MNYANTPLGYCVCICLLLSFSVSFIIFSVSHVFSYMYTSFQASSRIGWQCVCLGDVLRGPKFVISDCYIDLSL